MGNYRFRLSDMMPNAWFYKLKYITKTRSPTTNKKHHQPTTTAVLQPPPLPSNQKQPDHHHPSQPRRSYHLTRDKLSQNSTTISTTHCPDPPRKSSKKRRSTRQTTTRPSPRLVTTSVSTPCSCRTTLNSVWTKPDSTPEEYPDSPLDSSSEKESPLPGLNSGDPVFSSSTCPCKFDKQNEDQSKSIPSKFQNLNGFDLISEMDLPPIITKTKEPASSAKMEERNEYETLISKEQRRSSVRRISVSSPAGVKLRTISPRIGSRKIQVNGRKSISSVTRRSISESVAVVKRSEDPQWDFKESMVEMIMENNIRTSKDLEDLLACYLSLNSDEYHDVIIKVFKQIWFDVTVVRLK